MNVTLTPNIVEDAKKKGRAGLEIKLRVTGSCCGSAVTYDARFISSDRVEKLRERGLAVGENAYTVEQAVKRLLPLMKGGAPHAE